METLTTKDFDIGDLFYVIDDDCSNFIGKIGIVYDHYDHIDNGENYTEVDDHFRAYIVNMDLESFSTELHNTKLMEVPKAIEILYHEDFEKLKKRRI